jgi:amyotrophic lateral sclerosis 2 protein
MYYKTIYRLLSLFQGHGIMVLEDGTHYEGDFKSVGVFGGKGILTFYNEEKLEGNFSGAWNEGIKVTAVLRINNKICGKSQAEPP